MSRDIVLTKRGYIHIEGKEYQNLSQEHRDFVLKFNSRVKHGESTDELRPPNGWNLVQNNSPKRARKRKVPSSEGEQENQKKKSKTRKRVDFHVGRSDGNDGETSD